MSTLEYAGIERDRDLAAALWAVVSPRLQRCGGRLDELERRLRKGGAATPSADELCSARSETEALGWLMGCLAEGLDGRLFSQRCASEGLRWLLESVQQACAQCGRSVSLAVVGADEATRPAYAQLWACAEVLWLASESGPLECRVECSGEHWRLSCAGTLTATVAERARRWSGRAPQVEDARWTWEPGTAALWGEPT